MRDPTPAPDAGAVSEQATGELLLLAVTRDNAFANPAARCLARRLSLPDGAAATDAQLLQLLPEAARAAWEAGHEWRGIVETGNGDGAMAFDCHVFPAHCGQAEARFLLLRDIRHVQRAAQALERQARELEQVRDHLASVQQTAERSEKLASIGLLAAGVAHEINNPIGYVHSNLATLQDYLRQIFQLLQAYDLALSDPDARAGIAELRTRLDIDFVSRDVPALLAESREGLERVTRIVRDLKDVSRSGHDEPWVASDLHRGLDSTINIVTNQIRHRAVMQREYGDLPLVECVPSEINQVFMNLLVNAADAVQEGGCIRIETGTDTESDEVWISVRDDGGGIPPEVLPRIFDPFFTTKAVGKGSGLGLSISHGIVSRHGGRIDVSSEPGRGSCFRVVLPIHQPAAES